MHSQSGGVEAERAGRGANDAGNPNGLGWNIDCRHQNKKCKHPGKGASGHCPRSAAVPSRSSTDRATLPECSETQPLADLLRLGTAALRPGLADSPPAGFCARLVEIMISVRHLLSVGLLLVSASAGADQTKDMNGSSNHTEFR